MMKFLLAAVNAKYIHSNLAIYSLKAYAEEQRKNSPDCKPWRVELGEYTINQNTAEILGDIYKRKPDAVGFSCYIWNMDTVERLASLLHKVMPDMPVWLGGPEVSHEAEMWLARLPGVRGIMIGEGEETFSELLDYYEGERESLAQIRGLCYREADGERIGPAAGYGEQTGHTIEGVARVKDMAEGGTHIRRTADRPPLEMSRIPFPYQGMFRRDVSANYFVHKIIYYESSRGCPFSCGYCLSSLDKKLRFRDLALVKEELQVFLDVKVAQVKFIDRTFNCKKSHAMAIWSYLAEHDNGVTNFHFEIAADLLDEDMLAVLSAMRPGLVQLEIGVQTTCGEALAAVGRKTDPERIGQMVERVSSFHNIHQHLDLIAGLPMEGYERFARSFDDVYAMGPDQLQLGFLKVLRGSVMREQASRYGLVYDDRPPYEVLFTDWLSYEELLRLKQIEELVETYYNSGQFKLTLKAMGHRFASSFAMFEEMAEYFAASGYFGLNPDREARYGRILSFLGERCPEYKEVDRQLLTWDFYLRENAKKRPGFALDQLPWKERISCFFTEENKTGRYFPHYKGLSCRQLIHNVHLEAYTWDIPALAETGMVEERVMLVCYDYGMREPLSYNSAVTIL